MMRSEGYGRRRRYYHRISECLNMVQGDAMHSRFGRHLVVFRMVLKMQMPTHFVPSPAHLRLRSPVRAFSAWHLDLVVLVGFPACLSNFRIHYH